MMQKQQASQPRMRKTNKAISAFSCYVKEKRIQMGITQKELAEMSGLSYGFIQDVERGLITLNLSKLLSLISILGGVVEVKDRVIDQSSPFEDGL